MARRHIMPDLLLSGGVPTVPLLTAADNGPMITMGCPLLGAATR